MYTELLPSGRWRGGFRANGRKVQQTFDYQYEAEAWANAAELRYQQAGELAPPTSANNVRVPARTAVTLDEHGKAWLDRRRGSLRTATVSAYELALSGISTSGLGGRPLEALRKSEVERWITSQVDAGVGHVTINKRLGMARTVVQDAAAEGLLATDPTAGIRKLPVDVRSDRTLDWLEDRRLLAAAADDPALQAMLLLALDAGLRWGEVAGLGADCVKGDYVIVRQTVERRSGNFHRGTKSRKPRTVPTTPRLRTALAPVRAAAVAARGPQALLFTAGPARRRRRDAASVVLAPDGSAMLDYDNWLKQRFKPVLMTAALDEPQPRFHDLRHTYGSRLGAAGVPRSEIATLMGHADEATTARYIHAGTDGRRRDLVMAALAMPNS